MHASFSLLELDSEITTRNSAFSKPESDFCKSQISPKWGRANLMENMPNSSSSWLLFPAMALEEGIFTGIFFLEII